MSQRHTPTKLCLLWAKSTQDADHGWAKKTACKSATWLVMQQWHPKDIVDAI